MRQVTLQLIGIVLCLAGSASVGLACTCMHLNRDPATAFTAASAVFSGRVLEITEGKPSPVLSELKELTVKFRVERSWKLARNHEVTVLTVNTGNLCGSSFKVGERYLVYGRGCGKKFSTDICTRTTGLVGATEDLEFLKDKPLLKVKKSR